MRGKMKKSLLSMILCVCLGLTAACGGQETDAKQNKPVAESGPREQSESVALWMKGDLTKPPYTQGTQNWTCIETWEPALPEPDFDYVKAERNDYAVLGSNLFALTSFRVAGSGEQQRQLLYWLDGNTRECRTVTPFWEEEGAVLKVSGLEAVADQKLAVWGTLTKGEDVKQSLLLWDLSAGTGTVTDVSALSAARQGMVADQWCDAEGNIFLSVFEPEEDGTNYIYRLHIYSDKNKPGQAEELRTIDSDNRLQLYCRLSDGTPLLILEDSKAVYYDAQTGELKELVSVRGGSSMDDDGIVDAGGVMFSRDPNSNNVQRWDPVSGAYDKLFNLKTFGVNVDHSGSLLMGTDQAGQLLVLNQKGGKPAVSVFGPVREGEQSEGLLSLTNIWYHDGNVKAAAVRYSSLHPECAIDYFTGFEEDSDAFYDRTMMEVVSGKGSDLLFVHGEDMDKLYQKGALADISGIFDEDTCEQLISGVLESGTRDGKLIGVPADVAIITYMTVNEIWDQSSWTYEEAINLWQQYKDAGAICFQADSHTREELLKNFLLKNLADSPFLDLQAGTCNFDNGLFRQALELIGGCQCSYEPYSLTGGLDKRIEYAAQIKDGKYLVEEVFGDEVMGRSNTWEIYGEENCYPGYPSDSGIGNRLKCYGYLVVNADTEHFEEAADFLRYYCSKEFQSNGEMSNACLRKDVLREKYEVQDGQIIDKSSGGRASEKPGGGSIIDDVMAYLDSCGPEPSGSSEVSKIIEEEAAVYFQGTQDLDITVKNIQNRVQLYLDENN